MRPSAAVTSVDPSDILASVYQSKAGDPLTPITVVPHLLNLV